MTHDVDDLRIAAIRPLIPPAILLEEIPLSEQGKDVVFAGRQAIDDCLAGKDDRLVVVVGPCSIHDPEQPMNMPSACCQYATPMQTTWFWSCAFILKNHGPRLAGKVF